MRAITPAIGDTRCTAHAVHTVRASPAEGIRSAHDDCDCGGRLASSRSAQPAQSRAEARRMCGTGRREENRSVAHRRATLPRRKGIASCREEAGISCRRRTRKIRLTQSCRSGSRLTAFLLETRRGCACCVPFASRIVRYANDRRGFGVALGRAGMLCGPTRAGRKKKIAAPLALLTAGGGGDGGPGSRVERDGERCYRGAPACQEGGSTAGIAIGVWFLVRRHFCVGSWTGDSVRQNGIAKD